MAKIYIGIGHGLEPNGVYDPGAVSLDGVEEHGLNRNVVAAIAGVLDKTSISHTVEHDSGAGHTPAELVDDPDYRGSVQRVNNATPPYDLALEVHFDDAGAPQGGFGIYTSSAGQKFSQACMRRWATAGLFQRPSYQDIRGLYFLKGTNCPALIWECGRTQVMDGNTLITMGKALAAGICDMFGVSLPDVQTPSGPPPSPLAPPPAPAADFMAISAMTCPTGGWAGVGPDGGVFCFGDPGRSPAPFWGSLGGKTISAPIVAGCYTRDGQGYWLTGVDGAVYAFGTAQYRGGFNALHDRDPSRHIVGIAANDRGGYVQLSQDGRRYDW